MSIIYRYGVSMLSRKNHIKAVPEELMIDKETGQILLKQKNGKIISYDAMTRFKISVDSIRSTAEKFLFMGKIVSIVPENLPLPKCINTGDEILVEEVVQLEPIKQMLIQLDIDVIDTATTFGDVYNHENVIAEVRIKRGAQYTTIKKPVLQLADHVLKFDTSEATTIESIKITNSQETDLQYILQNILLIIA